MSEIAARFKRDIANHCMVVLHDQGLYRHVRFSRPSPHAWNYWFDLITVPGALIFRGDGESFVFSRTTDMFAFFRDSAYLGRPNPQYWAEKLTDGEQRAMRYSEDRFRSWVAEMVASRDDLPGLDAAVQRDVFDQWDISFEANARQALDEFRYFTDEGKAWDPVETPDFVFDDVSEEVFQGYYWWFLWACHAIVWGIAQYDGVRGGQGWCGMTIHHLKTWPEVYPAVADGAKRVELRYNDRDFAEGDTLVLQEWDPYREKFTGRSCTRRVTHVLQGGRWGLDEGTVALSIDDGFDWRRIATQVARYGGSYHGLTTPERDALEAEVDSLTAAEDRQAIADDKRFEWTKDAGSYHEGD